MWPDVCSLQHEISLLVPGSRVECVDFQGMDLSLQMQTAAEATLHITPHGGVAYSLLFSRPGCAAVVLVDEDFRRKAKDIYILPNLPWLYVMYLHRADEHLIHVYIMQAVVQASLSLGLPLPAFDFDAAEPFLRRRLAAHAAAAEEVKRAQLEQELQEHVLIAAAASQLEQDVEQSLGIGTGPETEVEYISSSSSVQVLAHRDISCAVFSNTRTFCWGHLMTDDGIRFVQHWPVPVRTRGAFLGKVRLIQTLASAVQPSPAGFLCGHHVDSPDASLHLAKFQCMHIQLKQEGRGQALMAKLGTEEASDAVFGTEGLSYLCVIMQHSGEVQCLGVNDSGQLGDGTLEFRNQFCSLHNMEACRVPLPLPVLALSVGYMHACAVVAAGAVYVNPQPNNCLCLTVASLTNCCRYCWGSNAGAQLGDGSNLKTAWTMVQPRPVLVSGMHAGAASVTASHDRTHAIMSNGAAAPITFTLPACVIVPRRRFLQLGLQPERLPWRWHPPQSPQPPGQTAPCAPESAAPLRWT